MSGLKNLLRNTAVLTVSGIVMRCVGLSYQVWLAGRIGSTGIGLFQLIASVNALCATFAISGIRFTSTRLCSEELGLGRPGGAGDRSRDGWRRYCRHCGSAGCSCEKTGRV